MNDTTCRICANQNATVRHRGLVDYVDCPYCGKFSITRQARDDWADSYLGRLTARQRANIAGWLRERPGLQIASQDLDTLFSLPSPSVAERADKLLLALQRRTTHLGRNVQIITQEPEALEYLGLTCSTNVEELLYLLHNYLIDSKHYVAGFDQGLLAILGRITPEGYAYLEKLRVGKRSSQIGFCAMWFSDEMQSLWDSGIEPAIRSAGYFPKRIDRHEHNNRIDDEIIAMLRRSRFVVADFTGQRGGVYFEAGFALGYGLPVVWTIREGDLGELHFDTRQYNFITWTPDAIAGFRERLCNRIEATIGSGPLQGA